MTGRDDESADSGADWFAAQFGAKFGADDEDDAPPVTPAAPTPASPATPPASPPAAPPTLVNPFGSAPGSPPVSPPPPPVAPPPAARPHAAPPASPLGAPFAQPPGVPATPPSAATPPPATPSPAAGGGFNWGLRPSGDDSAPPTPPAQPAPPAQQFSPPPAQQFPSAAQPAPPGQPAQPAPPAGAPAQPPGYPPGYSPAQASARPPAQPPAQPPARPPAQPPAVPHSAAPQPFAGPPPSEPLAPDLRAPSPFIETEPTQPFTPGFDDVPTQAYTPPGAGANTPGSATDPTEVFAVAGGPSGDALETLFAEEQFREVPVGPDPNEAPFARRASKSSRGASADGGSGGDGGDGGEAPPVAGFGRTQKILMAVAGALIGILALIVLFFLGTRLPDLLGPAPVITASPTPSASADVEEAIGPVEPGEYLWSELLGGECLEPYTDAWQTQYTVVDCAEPHTGQLVFRGSYQPEPEEGDEDSPATTAPLIPFPGVETLQAEIDGLCAANGVVNVEAFNNLRDVTMQGSYPATAEQWAADPSYRCFVTRSSGEPLDGDAAIPIDTADEG